MIKKKYVKPNIQFESFEFSASVAYGCAYISHSAEYACSADTGVGSIFVKDMGGCDYTPPTGFDMVCYHVPTVTQNIFTS